jgi:enoyl-CoA hydratase/carnithine racemase
MMTDRILAEREGAIGWLTINNPERRNAISLDMWQRMGEVLRAYATDDAMRVVVLRGAGGKSFAAGADISRFETERATPEQVTHYEGVMERAHAALASLPKPTIAMIQGFCVGGGVGIALDCDLRLCGQDAVFAIPAAKLGLGYGFDALRRLARVVGPAFAREILFTARRFDATEAAGMGLVNRVVPTDQIEAFARDYARTIAANAPLTVTAVKQILNEVGKDAGERDLALCERVVQACFESADYVEGRRAFMEKRTPVFRGR